MYTFVGASELWSLLHVGSFLVVFAGVFSVVTANLLYKLATPDPKLEKRARFLNVFGMVTSLIGFSGWCIVSLLEPSTALTQEAETRLSTLDHPTSAIDKEDILAFPPESDLSDAPWYVISPASAEGDNRFATHVQCITPDGDFHAATPKELAEAGAVIISHGQPEKAAPLSDNDLQQEWNEATRKPVGRWR